MSETKVTVLMALYNGGEYLKKSIKSVLNQSYQDFEFLIINDCSTDNSVELIDSFHDPRIRIHHNQENLGQTKSLNVGLKLARGEWIARMDADDFALKHWLEKQMSFVNEHPDYAVVSADAIVIDEHDKVQKKYLSPSHIDDIVFKAFFTSPINHVGCVMNKKVVLGVGGYDERYWTVADYDLWRKLICGEYRITSLNEVCVAIRRHTASLSFQDLDDDYIRQLGEIAIAFFSKYTKANLEQDQINTVFRSFYCPEKVSFDEFEKAVQYVKVISDNLLVEKFTQQEKVTSWSKKFMSDLILKRIQALILKKDYRDVHRSAIKGIKEFGILSLFSYFALASFFGGLFLGFVPNLYCRVLSSLKNEPIGYDFKIN